MRHLTFLLAAVAVAVATATFLATPPAAEAAGGGDVRRCGGGKIFLNADEKSTFALHNSGRRDRDLKPLCVHPDLQKAARSHSEDMIRRDYFSHDTKGRNESSCERVRRFGYRWRACVRGERRVQLHPEQDVQCLDAELRPPAQHPKRQVPRGRHRRPHRKLQRFQDHHVHCRLRCPPLKPRACPR